MEEHNPQLLATDPLGARSATALRQLQDRAQAAIAARREQAARLEADITARLDSIAAAIADEQATGAVDSSESDEAQAEAKRITAELQDARAAMELERAVWESEREALEKERDAAGSDGTSFEVERSAWETERSAWNDEQTSLQAERDELATKAAKLEDDLRAAEAEQSTLSETERTAQDKLKGELTELESKLLEERTGRQREQAEWQKERVDFEAQLDQARQKFELALEDLQRLRAKVNELEQELARRPEIDKADSAELVALRAERDALAARVDDLERAPAVESDASADQELADLRRRFELAVEDVRELKSKNARLEAQVATGKQPSGLAADGGDSMDWESQKRRLLASLEGGDDEVDPEVQKERASIESTIEMTDAVVAEKDQLITELKAQLHASGDRNSAAAHAEREVEVSKLLDDDAVIAEHRRKIAQLEQEMEGKLRAAELEVSVERANIARQRAELEELRSDLESQRHSQRNHDVPASPGTPRRRWLSKLGLTGEDNA